MPNPFATRVVNLENLWRKEEDGSFVIIYNPASATEDPTNRSKVAEAVTQATVSYIFTIVPVSLSTCRVTVVNKVSHSLSLSLSLSPSFSHSRLASSSSSSS
jgi:hypothetical protein